MIKIHKEGKSIIYFSTLISISLSISIWILLPIKIFIIAEILILTLMIFVFRFFRIPKRTFNSSENDIIAPADGKIVAIENVYEDEYFKTQKTQVSVFMSVYNVHINWFPISGSVAYFKYHEGKYLVARHPKSSELNERTSVVIQNGQTMILLRQIAGYVARRVICYAKEGMSVKQNDELGFIKFGSRVDMFLPTDADIQVKIGDKTTGGVTKIASLK
jgi:phosphatidylserine decarboxylase